MSKSIKICTLAKKIGVALFGVRGPMGLKAATSLQRSPYVSDLAVYSDIQTVSKLNALKDMNPACRFRAYADDLYVRDVLKYADIVVLSPDDCGDTTGDKCDVFGRKAEQMEKLAKDISKYRPEAWTVVAERPVNSMVPLVSEVYRRNGTLDVSTVFGLMTTQVLKANALVARVLCAGPESVNVPIVGGNSAETCVPIVSSVLPLADYSPDELCKLYKRIQSAEIIHEDGVSFDVGVFRFVDHLAQAMMGMTSGNEEEPINALIRCDVLPGVRYMSTQIVLGQQGVKKVLSLPKMSADEMCMMDRAVVALREDIEMGLAFANRGKTKCQLLKELYPPTKKLEKTPRSCTETK
ncbi:malate dehydrogenase, mitochondrial-like [Adelges cooleyi]|uniref:malate dehydrogenase, mitochondrial-like n=1 Tax=Adelges cooleyi TaxID=133065 RepID=UPI0021803D22|nr:malate dehydrogenase, mitochondrial-like [Adelges cooleyi]